MPRRKLEDAGLSMESTNYANISSEFAKSALFYLIFAGHFICSKKYEINRTYLDMFLLMHVQTGRLICQFEDKEWLVEANQIILMDCKRPHAYYSDAEKTTFQWIHFSGNSCQAYYEHLKSQNLLLSTPLIESTTMHINTLVKMIELPIFEEQTASILLHSILRNISTQKDKEVIKLDPVINWSIEYIHEHYAENITIDDISKKINLSKYHFIRSFKKATGSTPHEYLINLRLKRAMELLTTTSTSIEVISEKCGFSSASHFARCFRNVMGTNPSEFRTMYATQIGGKW